MNNQQGLIADGRQSTIEPGELIEKSLSMLFSISQTSSGAFYHIDKNYQTLEFTLFNIASTVHDNYISRFAELAPLNPKLHAIGDSRVLNYREVIEENSGGSLFAKEFLEYFGLCDAAELFFRLNGEVFAGISLFRSNEPQFYPAELDLLRRVHPFLEYTFQHIFIPHRESQRNRLEADYSLTTREIDVIYLIRSGASNKQIVEMFNISLGTVKAHLVHIFEKVEVKSRTELISVLFLD